MVDIFGAETESILGFPLSKSLKSAGLTSKSHIAAFGGGVIVLDQYGQVKYHVANRLKNPKRQQARVEYLLETGKLGGSEGASRLRFAMAHQKKMGG
jgi:hypothetical protein